MKAARVKEKSAIELLEIELHSSPDNLAALCQLSQLLFQLPNVPSTVNGYIQRALDVLTKSHANLSPEQCWQVAEVLMAQWKSERYTVRGSLRLNTSPSRMSILDHLERVLAIVRSKSSPSLSHKVSLSTAYVKECRGRHTEALAILSDLISSQASDGVDLSYIILKGAILLKHIGQAKQALEYFEFLQDDPPHDGFTRVNVLAYMVMIYETGGEKQRVFLPKAYEDLMTACAEAHAAGPTKQTKKLLEMVANPGVGQASELWELLAVHALDRCEYVLAVELLGLAVRNSPSKGTLLQRYTEALFVLNEREKAERVGTKAMELLPDAADLRDLLIQISPEKWTEKLRYTSPSKVEHPPVLAAADRSSSSATNKKASSSSLGKQSETWMGKIKASATSAIQNVTQVARAASPFRTSRPASSEQGSGSSPRKDRPLTSPLATPSAATAAVASPPQPQQQRPKKADPYDVKSMRPSRLQVEPINPSSRPQKPVLSEEGRRYLQLALAGNTNVHFYAKELDVLSSIKRQDSVARETSAC